MNEEIHNFLIINQIAFEDNPSFSIFRTYFLPQHKLSLHLISLQKFQDSNLPNDYFQQLSEQQNARGFRVIHLWEDVWMNKKDLVKSRILTMTGKFERLNARHCFVERIDKPNADKFLNDNHLQSTVSAKFKYGLFLKPQYIERFIVCEDTDNGNVQPLLIAVATFSGGRLMKYGDRIGQRSFELLRFATLQGYSVMGGLDKMLTAFKKEQNPNDIMTYADRDWSDGRSYEILGFERTETTVPQVFMINGQDFKRVSYDEGVENSMEIFNAGSIKFIRKSFDNQT